jgi:hypothetical protein
MAMDALKNIITNVPDWLRRLEELNGEIDRRQLELAAIGGSTGPRSLKNRGSTESLKPKDDGDAFLSPIEPNEPTDSKQLEGQVEPLSSEPERTLTTPTEAQQQDPPAPTSPGSNTPSAIKRQTQQALAVAQSRARAQVRKRHRTESVISAEGAPVKFRTRSMIIVYYDAFVQSFFEELVKFVSASRNLMRKAKMAAKVAQIRRMAEMEVSEVDEEGGASGDAPILEALPSLRYMRTRRTGPGAGGFPRAGGSGLLGDAPPDAYDELDKGLEYVQSMSEHAAHQFLRDGECTEEIGNIQRRLTETKELAEKEQERVNREGPQPGSEPTEPARVRMHRPTSMRRDLSSPSKDSPPVKEAAKPQPPETAVPSTPASNAVLEVDNSIEVDEGIDDMDFTPKLQYRSTRRMG